MIPNAKEALAEFGKYKAKMNAEMGETMKAFDATFKAALAPGALSLKEKELVVLGASVATRCEPCVLVHVGKALEAGCTRQEILEACALGIVMGGAPAMAFTPLVLKCLDEAGK
jgi:AhpD family alkylhydroperoxidase